MKTRDQSLDILRGMGIFLMVFDHVGWGTAVHTYIQSFHMPLFFIVSGYLWKNEKLSILAKKRFKTLLIPYFIFAFAYLFLQLIPVLNIGNTHLNSVQAVLLFPTDIDNMPIAPALWFLPCMFWTSIVYSLMSRLNYKMKVVCVVGITTLGMIFSSLSDFMLPFTIEPLTVALGFMLVGEFIKRNQDKLIGWLDKSWLIFILLIVEAILAILNRSVDMRSARYHNCVLFIVNSIVGTMAFLGIARKIRAMSAKILWGVQWLSFLSQDAMGFICMNQLFIMLFSKALKIFIPAGAIALIACKTVTFIVTMAVISWLTQIIMSSRFRIILGGK